MASAPTMFERQVRLDGCFNFRDLGGYPTRGGRWIRPDLLYRADGPHALTETDCVTLRTLDLPTWTDPNVVADRYREMLDGGSEVIGQALTILSDPASYPALIHCTTGKDRTGILSAIILGLLDASDDTILADYAESGAAMVAFVDYLKCAHPAADELLTLIAPAMVSAHPETMTAFIDGILRDYGSFAGLASALDAGGAPRALRALLVF